MKPLIAPLPGNEAFAKKISSRSNVEPVQFEMREFPDRETYLRLDSDCEGRDVILVSTLARPNSRLLPLVFFSETAREMGARSVTLVSPYLAYMRQDKRFNPGEGVTSRYFADLLSNYIDGLVTVDPHLHRYDSLDEIYTVPSRVVASAPAVSQWIRDNVETPVLIGPDAESEQWVSKVADGADAPFAVLEKERHNDHEVDIDIPEIDRWHDRTPVLVDDIISTAGTMAETVEHLDAMGLSTPVCVGVHGIFADDAEARLREAGVRQIISTNTVPHASNGIDVVPPVVDAIDHLLAELESVRQDEPQPARTMG